MRVLEEYIKAEEGSSDDERKRDDGDRGRARMRVGDRIEAKYRGRSKYYKGKISRVRADGTFDVACTTRCPRPRRAAFNGLSTHR